jgi:hypothetical protein
MPRVLRFVLLLLICLPILSAAAQSEESGPDYAVRFIRSRFSEDLVQTIVEFDVVNNGVAASFPAVATLNLIETGETVARSIVPPLTAGEIVTVSLPFATSQFRPNSVEQFRVAVGIGQIEQEGTVNVQDNFALISISFPSNVPTSESTPEATPEVTPEPSSNPVADPLNQLLDQLPFDRNDPNQVAVAAGITGAVLLLLLLVYLILRLVFRRPMQFSNWQPPYAPLFQMDPNSQIGRRIQWQMAAQSNVLLPPTGEGAYQVRKLPLGVDGTYLANWRVSGLRISQYDRYGRISRSQVIAVRGSVNRLNRIVRGRRSLKDDQVKSRIRPVARALSIQLRKKVNEKTALLPLMLDLRLQGKHGEIQLWFELFRAQYGQWSLVDRWQPEMTVSGKGIEENFTATLHGQQPGEKLGMFRKRLEDHLVQVLFDLVTATTPTPPANAQPTNTAMPPVQSPPQ